MTDLPLEDDPPSAPTFRARGRLLAEWSAMLVAATLLVGGLVLSGATTRLDNAIYDFALRFRHRPPPSDIVIVGIDFPSMTRQGPWPWSRDTLGALIDSIARDHPKAIVFEFLFQSKSSQKADDALRDAMSRAKVYLPEVLDELGKGHTGRLTKPIAEFGSVAAGVGRSNPTPDVDGIVRRAVLQARYQGRVLPELMVLVAADNADRKPGEAYRANAPVSSNLFDQKDEVLIPFAGPPGHFDQVSAADSLHGLISPGRLADKYVLIGPTAPGLQDNYPTPVSGTEGMPNVEVDANILDAILHHHLVRALPPTITVAVSLVLIWLSFFELLWFKPTQIALQPLGSLFIVLASVASLALAGLWFAPMSVVIVRTVVQIVWSSRRLQAASDYFARELAELESRAGGAILPLSSGSGLPMGDSVTRQMILIDETRRRIRELRRFVADVLANFADPVMVVSAEGRILMYNQAAIDLGQRLGRSTDPGAPVQPILRDLEEATGGKITLWPPAANLGAPPPRAVAPGGRILEARYTPTGHEDGEAKGWTIHLVDITALVSAMRQREEALQLFTHDMRAPQSAILAALEHEDFQSVPQPLRERIARNAMRTLGLADGFVRLAQAESAEYIFAPIDLFHLLGDAADALWPIARAASVEVIVEDPGREFVVNADRSLLARALINLLDNAVKFSAPCSRVVCTLAETRLRDRSAVACAIADQARGMTPEEQRSLFKPFARSPRRRGDHDTGHTPASGVGLGLAMVQTVVTRHDGVIDCLSEVGRGTVFTVTLPLCANDEAAEEDDSLRLLGGTGSPRKDSRLPMSP